MIDYNQGTFELIRAITHQTAMTIFRHGIFPNGAKK